MKLYEELNTPYQAGTTSLDPHEHWLAERCALTNDGNWFIRQRDGYFEQMKNSNAAKLSMRQWVGGDKTMRVTWGDIETFLKTAAPVVKGGMKVPTSTSPFIRAFDHVFVNTWKNTVMQDDPTALQEPKLRLKLEVMLRMIREALCGMPDAKSLDEMIAIINGDDPAEIAFRFTMQWLAAPIQQIGRNMQCNLWHVGELGGMGKGTLSTCMARIYGFGNYCLFNQDEAKQGGWNDALAGALFVSWNEVSQSDGLKFDCNSFIKSNTTDEVMQIRKRNIDSFPVLNFANYYFTGNRETCPWGALDYNDRRNAIFAGSDDLGKRRLALELREFLKHDETGAATMLRGLIYLLRQMVKIDEDLMKFAPDTEIKREMQDAASPEIDGLYWLENADDYQQGEWVHGKELLTSFKLFMEQPKMTPRRFAASILGKLSRKGYVQRRRPHESSRWEYYVDPERYPRNGEARRTGQAPVAKILALLPHNR